MQMQNCSRSEASILVKKASPYINQPITSIGQTLLMVASSVGSYYIVQ